jgi:acyl-CoA thioester hydrolase
LRQTVRSRNGVCATLRIKLACVRIGGNKPARIPPQWREGMHTLRRESARGAALRHDVAAATEKGD